MIVENIRQLCAEKGISIWKLEQQLGFSHNSVAKWNDHLPSIGKALAVARFFGISVEQLVTGIEKK